MKREHDELLISSDDTGVILVRDISTKECPVVQKVQRTTHSGMLMIRQDLLWVFSQNKQVYVYRLGAGKEPLQFEKTVAVQVTSWFGGSESVGGKQRQYLAFDTGTSQSFNLFSLQTQRMVVFKLRQISKNHGIVMSDRTKEVYCCGQDRQLRGFSLRSHKLRFQTLTPHSNYLNSQTLVRKDRFLLVGSADHHVSVLNTCTLQLQFKVFSYSDHIYVMLTNTDESELVVGGNNGHFLRTFQLTDSLLS